MLQLLALYEPDELDEIPIYSAIFIGAEQYFVEVRVDPQKARVYQCKQTNPYNGRLTCLAGEIMLETTHESLEEGMKYFWGFVKDPEMGFMEATI